MTVPVQVMKGEISVEPEFDARWKKIATMVQEHPLWQDPFAKTLKDPEVDPQRSYALVEQWTRQMYHGSLAFPRYVGNLIGRVENHAAGRLLAINSAVERGYPDENRSHFLLAVDLLKVMGLSEEEIVVISKANYSSQYIDRHLRYTRDGSLARGIGCLGLGIEALTTDEFTMIGNAFLRTATMVKSTPMEKAYQSQGYFTENIMADIKHTSEFEQIAFLTWRSGEIPRDIDQAMKEIREGALFSLDSRREFFRGIYTEVTDTKK